MSRVRPFGEAAFLVEVDGPDAAQGIRRALLAEPIEGITGVVPGRASLLVEFDPLTTDATAREECSSRRTRRAVLDGVGRSGGSALTGPSPPS